MQTAHKRGGEYAGTDGTARREPDRRTPKRRLGDAGEQAACNLLRQKGYAVLARNWRFGRLELDIVCRDGSTIVFAEVKTRTRGSLALPGEAVDLRKRKSLFKAARAWLARHDAWDAPCRFDVVCVTHSDNSFTAEHIENAFTVSGFVDGGNAAWQPW